MPCPPKVIIQKCSMSQLQESSLNRWILDNSSVGVASKCWARAHLWSAELSLKRMTFKNHHCHHTDLLIRLFWVLQNDLGSKLNTQISTWMWKHLNNRVQSIQCNHSFSFQNLPLPPDLCGYPLTQNDHSHFPPVEGTIYDL